MQYLIRTLTDSTGTPFTHVTKARENESYTVVEAESKEEAKRKYNYPPVLSKKETQELLKSNVKIPKFK